MIRIETLQRVFRKSWTGANSYYVSRIAPDFRVIIEVRVNKLYANNIMDNIYNIDMNYQTIKVFIKKNWE